MWATVLCPKCGVRNELDPSVPQSEITCTRCFNRFTLPANVRYHFEETSDDELVLAQEDQPELDSSFWLA